MMPAYEIWEHARLLAEAKPVIPNPAPAIPGAVSSRISTLLGWWKWGALVAGLFGLIGCGAMMAAGRRNRSMMAVEGAVGIPWTLLGLTIVVLSSGIVGVFT